MAKRVDPDPRVRKLLKQLDFEKDKGNWKKVADIAMKLNALEQENPEKYRITLKQYLARLGMKPGDAKSQEWFKRTYGQLKRKKFKPEDMKIGGLYFYKYKPETEGTWDFAPLMLNLGPHKTRNGHTIMLGLNLHYIPANKRAKILISLSDLMVLGSRQRLLSQSRMAKLTWEIVKKELGINIAKLLIHSYRLDRFQSAPEEIHPADFASVIRMPLQKFKAVKRKS
ncbi:DNA end protector [Vibrio phage D479]